MAALVAVVSASPAEAAAPKAVKKITFSNIKVAAIKNTSVVIRWDTDVAATGQIEYGLNTRYGNLTKVKNLNYWHPVKITDLTGGKTYHYRILATDIAGKQTVSVDYTFTTRTKAQLQAVIRAARAEKGLPKTYYVKPDGNDGSNGLTVGTAWRHPSYAAQQVDAGDTILVLKGTWKKEQIHFKKSGCDVAPITMKTHSGAVKLINSSTITIGAGLKHINIDGNFVLDGGGVQPGTGVHLGTEPKHITISGVTVRNIKGDAFAYRRGRYITFDGVTAENASEHGILSFGYPYSSALIDYVTVRNCTIKNTHHNGLDLHTNNHHVTVENNYFEGVTNSAAIFCHNKNDKKIVIRGNKIVKCSRGIWLIGTDECLIEKNTMLNNKEYGILLYCTASNRFEKSGVLNVTIRNNTIAGSQRDVMLLPRANKAKAGIRHILFESNFIKGGVTFSGEEISDITVRNPRDISRKYVLSSDVSRSFHEFTDGRTFSIDGSGRHTRHPFPRASHTVVASGPTPPRIKKTTPHHPNTPVRETPTE